MSDLGGMAVFGHYVVPDTTPVIMPQLPLGMRLPHTVGLKI